MLNRLGLCGNRNEFKILKEVVHARQGMKHETKIALSDNKNKRSTGAFVGFDLICLSSAAWVPVGCRLGAGWVPVGCRLSASSGIQPAECLKIKQIAAEVPLEPLQGHSTGRKPINQANCRRSAAGGTPGALNRQKAHKSSKLPAKCRWRNSRGTQMSEIL